VPDPRFEYSMISAATDDDIDLDARVTVYSDTEWAPSHITCSSVPRAETPHPYDV
jgi:hypothetical protein